MAISDYYVDPSIAANSGTGTIGDPYGDLQYALDQITRDGTDGDRINVKAGTAESLTGSLSLATYGTPSYLAPLIFQGYTSAQGDGGLGQIDCNANTVITNAGTGIGWYDMDIFDGPAASALLIVSQWGAACGVKVSNSDGHGIQCGIDCIVSGCWIEDVGDATHDGIFGNGQEVRASHCYIKQGGARTMRSAIHVDFAANVAHCIANIISLDGSSHGIHVSGSRYPLLISGNSILSSSGTGTGINLTNATNMISLAVINNAVEGFSGTGGVGYDLQTSTGCGIFASNFSYNNTSHTANLPDSFYEPTTNVATLSGSPFEKNGSDTFANRFEYFKPADEGAMRTGGWPEVG